MDELTFQENFRRAASGDREAFTDLYHFFQPRLFASYRFRFACGKYEPHDIFNRTMMRLWGRFNRQPSLEPRGIRFMQAYLTTIANGLAYDLDEAERQRNEATGHDLAWVVSPGSSEPEAAMVECEELLRLRGIFQRLLTRTEFVIISLAYLEPEPLSIEDIAEILGISCSRVRGGISEARAKLRIEFPDF